MEPLQALRKIFQEAGELSSADELLHLIVTRVKEATHSDVCSIYLADEEQDDWVLVATEGLSSAAIGKVRMRTGEGLVGHICKHQSLHIGIPKTGMIAAAKIGGYTAVTGKRGRYYT